MNLVGLEITHNSLGHGHITAHTSGIITVIFESGKESRFQYPEAFRKFLRFTNDGAASMVDAELQAIDEKKAQVAATQIVAVATTSTSLSERKKLPRSEKPNIAFKCNFCDGGATEDTFGYHGICSDGIIFYNIEVDHRTWCSSPDCPCFQYHRGEMTREELEAGDWGSSFTCYESGMLKYWVAKAGIIQNGERKGQPMRLSSVRANGLCVLTTREPYTTEDERVIFAVFLIDDTYDGDDLDEGYVSGKSKYRVALTPDEAHKVPFWKYHANENKPEVPAWSSGLHRYMTDEQAAQILRDVVAVKEGKRDHDLAVEFFEEFCRLAKIDPTQLGEATGTLTL